MHAVADLQAQLVATRLEVDRPFGLAGAEVDVIGVADDRFALGEAAGVGDDVEVAGSVVHFAGFLDGDAVGGHL